MNPLNTNNIRMRLPAMATKFLLPGLLIINSACTQPGSNPDEIRKAYDAYNAAFEKNDVDAILSFYTDDAVRLPADGSIVAGLPAIRDSMTLFREENDYVLDEYGPAEIQMSGDLAVTYSTFDEHWTPRRPEKPSSKSVGGLSCGRASPTAVGRLVRRCGRPSSSEISKTRMVASLGFFRNLSYVDI